MTWEQLINKPKKRKQRLVQRMLGMSSVEVIVSVAVLAFVIVGIAGGIIASTEGPAQSADQTKAYQVLEEGFTALKAIRDEDFTNLTSGTYGLDESSGNWQLGGSNDTEDGFTREVTITNLDSYTKQADISVSWVADVGGVQSVTSSHILTDIRRTVTVNPPPTGVDWSNPQEVGTADTSGNQDGYDVKISGDYAFLITDGTGSDFASYDISDPANPVLVDTLDIPNDGVRLEISGDYAFVTNTTNSSEIIAVDISDPANLNQVGSINLTGGSNPNGLEIVGNYLYLARSRNTRSGQYELTIVDISNPTNITFVGGYDINQNSFDVEIVDNYAYVASSANNSEVYIIDISNPANPTLAGNVNLSNNSNAYTLEALNDTLYVSRNNGDLHVLDITNRTNPVESTVFDAGGRINRIDFDSGEAYAFLATSNYNAEFVVLDTTDPLAPSQVAFLNTQDIFYSIDYDPTLQLIAAVGNNNNNELVLIYHEVILTPGEDLCRIDYNIGSQWGSGFVVNVSVNNISSNDISSWTIEWSFDGNQNITNYWNVNLNQNGSDVTGNNLSYNSNIPAGGSQSFGFQATYSGSNNAIPSDQFTVNGSPCVN